MLALILVSGTFAGVESEVEKGKKFDAVYMDWYDLSKDTVAAEEMKVLGNRLAQYAERKDIPYNLLTLGERAGVILAEIIHIDENHIEHQNHKTAVKNVFKTVVDICVSVHVNKTQVKYSKNVTFGYEVPPFCWTKIRRKWTSQWRRKSIQLISG